MAILREMSNQSSNLLRTLRDEKNHQVCLISRHGMEAQK